MKKHIRQNTTCDHDENVVDPNKCETISKNISDSDTQLQEQEESDILINLTVQDNILKDLCLEQNKNIQDSSDETNDSESKKEEKIQDSEPKYRNLVISGGSVKGISHIGAVKHLIDEKLLDFSKLKSVAGTSAGSLFGLLIVLGFEIEEIWNFIYCLDMKKIVKPDFFMFLNKCGVESGQTIHNLFEEILTKKTGIKHINFRQLFELTKIHFIVVGSCLTTKEVIYYDHINTPTFKVSMAIRISISMPGFFVPVTIDDKKYIDGGILNNYPMNLFEDRIDETIGILICNEYSTNYNYPEEYFMAVMNLFMHNYYQKTFEQYKENTIYVKESPENVNAFNFNVDSKTKLNLYNNGIASAEEFVKRLNEKKNEILSY